LAFSTMFNVIGKGGEAVASALSGAAVPVKW